MKIGDIEAVIFILLCAVVVSSTFHAVSTLSN